VAYRYRKFALGDINLVVRCELHGWTQKRNEDLYITSHSLNEWDSKYSGGVEWRQKIDQQRSAIFATEVKNNSCKLARWTAESILANADLIKLGYVSRVNKSSSFDHAILATQFFKPKELATTIAMTLNNMWGIVKMICDLISNQEDGKYVLLKDPNRPVVRLYSVPVTAFESDEDGDENEGLENEDAEEDADNGI
jgi:translation initiation factor 3 subunit D